MHDIANGTLLPETLERLRRIDVSALTERVQIEARLRDLQLGVVGALVQLPVELWEVGYNKTEELEADREGMRLAVQAVTHPTARSPCSKARKTPPRIRDPCGEPRG